MTTITKRHIKEFVKNFKTRASINFPKIAQEMGLSWFSDFMPEIKKNPEFKELIEEALVHFKFELLDNIFEVAVNGRPATAKLIDKSYIDFAVKLIDSGVLLGKEEELPPPPTPIALPPPLPEPPKEIDTEEAINRAAILGVKND